MALSPGTRLGPYEITAQIGVGGMGEVYRARDTNLKRAVAIKVLPASVASDVERLARFQREAEVLASLNHPNIAAIYGLEKRDGTTALVMELVEGPTLAERIAQGALPVDEALSIAKQIAEGLETAHEQGIIHRDLKPANIALAANDQVKVLDFGLAKLAPPEGLTSSDPSASPTITSPAMMTGIGMILGTAAYMSPEQAKGRVVDKRSDVWAFGCVLYEMLAGKRAFEGDDVTDTLAAVLRGNPDWTALPSTVPASVCALIQHCLEKDPRQRIADISVVSYVLKHPFGALPIDGAAAPRVPPRQWVAPLLGVFAAVAAASTLALAFVHFREARTASPTVRFHVPLPESTRSRVFELSPDGRYLAIDGVVMGRERLIGVRRLDALEVVPLPGTDGATYPFWSPDSSFIGFFADEKLKKVAVTGGPPQPICDAPGGRRATWNAEGTIVFASLGRGLVRVPAAGGVPTPVTTPTHRENELHRFPWFLPDGQRFLYLVTSGTPEITGIYVGSLDGAAPVRLLPDASNAVYAPSSRAAGQGDLLFVRDNTLVAQPFDADRAAFIGETFPVAEQIGDAGNQSNRAFSVSSNGILAFQSGPANVNRELVWMDRTGKRIGVVGDPGAIHESVLSPDETRLALVLSRSGGGSEIWAHDVSRGIRSRLATRAGSSLFYPLWSPDGRSIVFTADSRALYRKFVAGGEEELLLKGGINLRPTGWSRDGEFIAYDTGKQNGGEPDVWLLPLKGTRTPIPYLQTTAGEFLAQFSPDGRWMAYTSQDAGLPEVYVQAIPATGSRSQISTTGGIQPRWRRDGRELFYLSTEGQLMAVAVKPGSSFETGSQERLFDIGYLNDPIRRFVYQPTADGQRFLVTAPVGGGMPSITVVLNWLAEVKRE